MKDTEWILTLSVIMFLVMLGICIAVRIDLEKDYYHNKNACPGTAASLNNRLDDAVFFCNGRPYVCSNKICYWIDSVEVKP